MNKLLLDKFSSDKNKNEIKEKYERSKINKRFFFLSGVMGSFLLIFLVILPFINQDAESINCFTSSNTNYIIYSKDNIEVYFNQADNNTMSSDLDVLFIDTEGIDFIKNWNLPNDMKKANASNVYTRGDNKYDVLDHTLVNYTGDDYRTITIKYSSSGKPLSDWFINASYKVSLINEIEFMVVQDKDIYIVTFKNEDTYYEIEARYLKQEELVDLLSSIN